jgi:putative methyltransferase
MSLEYREASKIVDIGLQGKSVKAYCAGLKELSKKSYALALQTLKFSAVMAEILEETNLKESFEDIQRSMLYVMLYDFLFGKKDIRGGGEVKRRIMENRTALEEALLSRMVGKDSSDQLLSDEVNELSNLPLHVRINEARLSTEKGVKYLREKFPDLTLNFDDLIPSLIELPSSVKGIGQDSYVKEGKLIIQDKASCFPSQILFNAFQREEIQSSSASALVPWCFIDACAAPGNKTTHLASLVSQFLSSSSSSSSKQSRRVFAFEKNPSRCQLLQKRIAQYNLTSMIEAKRTDYLSLDCQQYSQVRYILLDPSCSGSGIARNLERILPGASSASNNTEKNKKKNNEIKKTDEEGSDDDDHKGETASNENNSRLLKLQSFQVIMLKKSSSFPNAQYIVYSTCSIHCEENETVVSQFLSSEEGMNWELTTPPGFEKWTRRGMTVEGIDAKQAKKMIRCLPEDKMNGFFVALLKKKNYIPQPVVERTVEEDNNRKNNNTMKNKRKLGEMEGTEGQPVENSENKPKLPHNPKISNSGFHIGKKKKRKFSKL